MSHLRTKLEHATREYQTASYPGNLALDVLGPVVAKPRRNFAPLAIAAALALGLSVGIFAGRFSNSSTPQSAVATDTVSTPVTSGTDIAPEISPRTDVAGTGTKSATQMTNYTTAETATETTSAVAGAFTVVPSANTFTGRSVSVVPDLATLETIDEASADAAIASAEATSNNFAPMSLMLLSASEYGDQQQTAADVKTKSNTATHSEERS